MRYLPHTEADRGEMLAAIGVGSIDDLFRDVPKSARLTTPLDLPDHRSELEVEQAMAAMAAKNVTAGAVPFFIGAGAYRHHVPAAVDYLIQRGEFLTAYTPYQPEISQGTLQTLFEFQTMVALITGMDVANASMYDGASACAEAVLMAHRVTRRDRAVLSGTLHPHYRAVTETISRYNAYIVDSAPATVAADEDLASMIDDRTSCVVVQNPDVFGNLRDLGTLAEACHEKGALLIAVVAEVVSLGLVRSPGDMGADIVVCEGQSIGNPLGFGGPYLGLFATRDKFVRQMPGRLCGETVDANGARGYVLTLSTREQHIRREKATSNICTNSGLCATAFAIHMTLLGETGFQRLAAINHGKAVQLAERLEAIDGPELLTGSFFNEFTVRLARPAAEAVERLADGGILAGVPASRLFPDQGDFRDLLLVAATEMTTEADMDALAEALKEAA
jgi:glycine dehydrogenase subunit 1